LCAGGTYFFFNDTATTEIYTLSLHDALPIFEFRRGIVWGPRVGRGRRMSRDRKSTRLNSSHITISYAVFCLKKKNVQTTVGSHQIARGLRPVLLALIIA